MATLRDLGVKGVNREVNDARVVNPANMKVGGIIGQFERKYKVALKVSTRDIGDFIDKFGYPVNATYYGYDVVKGFIDNVSGANAELWVKSHVGYTGSAYDGVAASAVIANQTPVTTLTFQAAYQNELDYGVSGNRIGYTLTNGFRYSTTAAATAAASDYSAVVSSAIGIKIGDVVKFTLTGGGAGTSYHTITAVNYSTNTITWTDAVLHATRTLALTDVIQVMGIKLRIWRKDINGVVSEVDKNLGAIYCSLNSTVTEFFIENVFNGASKWLKVTKSATTPATPELDFPSDVTTVTYLTSGADGTAPTTSAHWAIDLTAFSALGIRFLTNAETVDITTQKAGETYCKARNDTPIWLFNLTSDRTKAQLQVIGNSLQRADEVDGVAVADWLKVQDPYTNSPTAPYRTIPSVGHIMGVWIRTIATRGAHYIPTKGETIYGINDIANTNLGVIADSDRVDIANAGVNLVQYIAGYGYVIRNLFTPSITSKYQYGNKLIQRNFVKVSSEASLQISENEPNSWDKIQADRDAIYSFMSKIWLRGDNNNTPAGEWFGQYQKDDGTLTTFDEMVQVIADAANNPLNLIQLGERHIDVIMSTSTPAGLVQISVGISL
jgi:hypothetical protein